MEKNINKRRIQVKQALQTIDSLPPEITFTHILPKLTVFDLFILASLQNKSQVSLNFSWQNLFLGHQNRNNQASSSKNQLYKIFLKLIFKVTPLDLVTRLAKEMVVLEDDLVISLAADVFIDLIFSSSQNSINSNSPRKSNKNKIRFYNQSYQQNSRAIIFNFLKTAPTNFSLIYIKDLAMVLPDNFNNNINNTEKSPELYYFLKSFDIENEEGLRNLAQFSALITALITTLAWPIHENLLIDTIRCRYISFSCIETPTKSKKLSIYPEFLRLKNRDRTLPIERKLDRIGFFDRFDEVAFWNRLKQFKSMKFLTVIANSYTTEGDLDALWTEFRDDDRDRKDYERSKVELNYDDDLVRQGQNKNRTNRTNRITDPDAMIAHLL